MHEDLVRHVVITGLEVVDPVRYSLYCARMRPILVRYGGRVEYDFVVDEVIESPTEIAINRVRALSFPSPAVEREFWNDAEHRALRAELRDRAVADTALIGAYAGPGIETS